jgi:anti-sigma regulatory factor (Ser/Thr protein kinase)
VRNAWVHAGGGRAIVEELEDDTRHGIRARFEDDGPGIADLPRVLNGGYSTARTMGLGLSGSRRLVDDFEIESTPRQRHGRYSRQVDPLLTRPTAFGAEELMDRSQAHTCAR